MKILITGATGFLGAALARRWIGDGHEVFLLLRSNSKLDRLRDLLGKFESCRCDTDIHINDFVKKIGPDAVVHAACTYGRAGEPYLQLLDTNVRLGLVLLQALEGKHPHMFINTGSGLAPHVSPYALSKFQFSQWGKAFAAKSNTLHFLNVVLQHMYGPGDDPSKFTTHVIHSCKRHDKELKLTKGEQIRDFIYIDDAVNAFNVILINGSRLEQAADIEVGSGEALTVRKVVETIKDLTSSNTELIFGEIPYRHNEAMYCIADISAISQLGWLPKYDFESGLVKTIELEFSK